MNLSETGLRDCDETYLKLPPNLRIKSNLQHQNVRGRLRIRRDMPSNGICGICGIEIYRSHVIGRNRILGLIGTFKVTCKVRKARDDLAESRHGTYSRSATEHDYARILA